MGVQETDSGMSDGRTWVSGLGVGGVVEYVETGRTEREGRRRRHEEREVGHGSWAEIEERRGDIASWRRGSEGVRMEGSGEGHGLPGCDTVRRKQEQETKTGVGVRGGTETDDTWKL